MNPDDTIEDEPLKQEGRSGGEATAFEMPVLVSTSDYLRSSLIGGLIAAAVFLAYVVLLDLHDDPFAPFRVLASLAAGDTALSPHSEIPLIVVAGLLSVLVLSELWSSLFGLLLGRSRREWTPASIVSTGMVYGSVIWIVDFYILAPIFWPWIMPLSSVYMFFGFVFFFGLPLGAWVASRTMR